MAEVRVSRAWRQDEKIVVEHAVGEQQPPRRGIDPDNIRQHHLGISLPPQDPPDRRGNVPRRERRRRHLIQQRLEHVIIPAIDDGHPHRSAPERPRRVQTSESTPDNHHARFCHDHLRVLSCS
jgi:hypothetical protein